MHAPDNEFRNREMEGGVILACVAVAAAMLCVVAWIVGLF